MRTAARIALSRPRAPGGLGGSRSRRHHHVHGEPRWRRPHQPSGHSYSGDAACRLKSANRRIRAAEIDRLRRTPANRRTDKSRCVCSPPTVAAHHRDLRTALPIVGGVAIAAFRLHDWTGVWIGTSRGAVLPTPQRSLWGCCCIGSFRNICYTSGPQRKLCDGAGRKDRPPPFGRTPLELPTTAVPCPGGVPRPPPKGISMDDSPAPRARSRHVLQTRQQRIGGRAQGCSPVAVQSLSAVCRVAARVSRVASRDAGCEPEFCV